MLSSRVPSDVNPPPTLFVVDDDEETRRLFELFLRQAGYAAEAFASSEEALTRLAQGAADILISDIHLPGLSGFDLVGEVRERGLDLEVIILTGEPAVDSAIKALRIGAADYLTKPVRREALIEAVEKVYDRLVQARRRRRALALLESGLRQMIGSAEAMPLAPAEPSSERVLSIGPVEVDRGRMVIRIHNEVVDATPSEFEILYYLARNAVRVVTPPELVRAMRGYQVDPEQAAEMVRPHVSNLRRKLLAVSREADIIITVRGVGYMLREPGPARPPTGNSPSITPNPLP